MGSLRDFGKFREIIWTTADGRKVKIKDMTDQHVINVIWHIYDNKAHFGAEMLQNFVNEANFRGLHWSLKSDYKYPVKTIDPKRYENKFPVNSCIRCGKTPSWCECTWRHK